MKKWYETTWERNDLGTNDRLPMLGLLAGKHMAHCLNRFPGVYPVNKLGEVVRFFNSPEPKAHR